MEYHIMQVTIICVWHKEQQFIEFKNNLSSQKDVEFNLIAIDNSTNKYSSIREIYNGLIDEISTEYVMFCHPDIVFLEDNVLFSLIESLSQLSNLGVVGIAGCREGQHWEILSNIVHGDNMKLAGTPIKVPERVQMVDECLYIMKSDFLKNHKYSDITGWHLYAVEQCLNAIAEGLNNYVVPVNIWHRSDGKSLDPSYLKSLELVIKNCCKDIDYLNTTVKQWKTRGIWPRIYRKYYYLKQIVKKCIR